MCTRVAIILTAVAAAACSSSSSQSSDAADHPMSAGDAALESNPEAGADAPAQAMDSGHPDRPDDAQTSPPANTTFPEAPSVSCQADAGDQGGCDFPVPACAVIGFDDAGIPHGN